MCHCDFASFICKFVLVYSIRQDPNEHNDTMAKAIPVVAQQSKDVRMDNLALYGNFLTKVNLR
jgi:hypothetical protein